MAGGANAVLHALATVIKASLLFAGDIAQIVIVTTFRLRAEASHHGLPFGAMRARFDAVFLRDLMDDMVRDFVWHGLLNKVIEIFRGDEAVVADKIFRRVIIACRLTAEIELDSQRLNIAARKPGARRLQAQQAFSFDEGFLFRRQPEWRINN